MVEKLVSSFLDTGSILALAKCHQLTLDLLNTGNSVWKKLISRTCPESVRINLGHIRPPRVMSDRMVMTTVLQQERAEMANLIPRTACWQSLISSVRGSPPMSLMRTTVDLGWWMWRVMWTTTTTTTTKMTITL